MKTLNVCAPVSSALRLFAIASLCLAGTGAEARTLAHQQAAALPVKSADLGAVPSSQPMSLTLYLAPTTERTAALQQYLGDVQTPGSASYHKWLTPTQFGQRFGATASQMAAVSSFAQANGLTVGTVSASGLRVSVTGAAASMERAMSPALHTVQLGGQLYVANTAAPTLPESLADTVIAIDGLTTVPETHAFGPAGAEDSVAALAAVVDANVSRVLALNGGACVEDVDPAMQSATQMVLRQAAAQGMTVVAAAGCGARGSASFPGSLGEVVTVATAPGTTPDVVAGLTELRPSWQAVVGLPADGFRHSPDVTVTSLDALVQTLNKILLTQPVSSDGSAARLGNIDAVLYRSSSIGGVFSQADGAAAGTWEAATGLGNLDLGRLGSVFPNAGTISDQTQLHITGTGSHGQTVTIYATVADVTGSGNTPSGTVLLTSNPAGVNTTLTVTGGTSSSYSSNTLPAGSYTFTATYQGDANFAGSTGTGSFTIQPEDSALTASVSGNATFGSTFHVTVTDRSPSGVDTPTGNINIVMNGSSTTIPSQALTQSSPGTATASFDIPAVMAGTVSLNVSCSSTNPSFTCNTAYPLGLSIAKATPSVSTLTVSPAAPVYGSTTTFTETFTGPSGYAAPSGYAQISEAGQYVVGGNLTGGTFTGTSSTISGTVAHTFTANFTGDNNYNASSATATTTGAKIATTLTMNAPSKTAVVTGGSVTLNATLTLASFPAGLNATGTVQFFVNGAQVGQAQTVFGTSTTVAVTLSSVTLQTIGTDAITATYSGDSNYAGSTSTNSVSVIVGPATTIALTSSATTAVAIGTTVTLTAVVNATPTSGAAYPTGNITFTLTGGTFTTPPTFNAAIPASTGPATTVTVTGTFLMQAAGAYSVTATCGSGVNFDCSNVSSNAVTITVNKTTTTTTITANPTSPAAGATVALTATVAPTVVIPNAVTLTGSVQFYDNGVALGGPAIVGAGGVATTTGVLAGTNDTVSAVYSGDINYLTSTGTLTVKVQPVVSTSTLTANTTKALAGSQIILTLSVGVTPTTDNPNPGVPTGTVAFYDSYNGQTIPLGSGTLVASGPYLSIAQLVTTGLLQGTHNITAVYGGTTSFLGSTSNVVVINLTDYAVAFTPTSLTVTRGSNATAFATVTALNGFAGQVVLGCTAPAGTATTCSFSPAVISGSGTAQLFIGTTAPQAARGVEHAGMSGLGRGIVGTGLAMMLAGMLLPSVRRRRPVLMALLVSCLMLSSFGCTNLVNPATSNTGSNGGTPLGTQIFSITTSGTDGVTTTRHNTQFQVTVQ